MFHKKGKEGQSEVQLDDIFSKEASGSVSNFKVIELFTNTLVIIEVKQQGEEWVSSSWSSPKLITETDLQSYERYDQARNMRIKAAVEVLEHEGRIETNDQNQKVILMPE